MAWPNRDGAGPITDPGGRDAGIRARTGASTIFMLLLLILLLYLKNTILNSILIHNHFTYFEYKQQMVMVAMKATRPMNTAMIRIRTWIQFIFGADLT